MKFDEFANLHVHSTFSTFDGLGQPEDFAKYAKELNQSSLALTDHGTVSGLLKHFQACKNNDIKPLMGCECYFTLDHAKKIKNNYHMTIIAKSDKGYSNLMKLITEANVNGFYYRPKIDIKSLLKYKEDLIIMSGCQASIFYQYAIVQDKKPEAIKLLKLFKKHFKDFYLEIQPHKQGCQEKVTEFAFKVNKKLGIPLVLTIDTHYPRPEDDKTQWILRKIKIQDASLEQYAGMHLHNRESAEKLWYKNYDHNCAEALDNTVKIANMCDVKLDFGNLLDLEWNGEDRTRRLKRLAKEGLKRIGKYNDETYRKQLAHEIDVVCYHGFEDVFLATEDMCTWSNQNGIQTGPGRGSGVGSLLTYCLGISKVDPLENHLLFERFLRKDKKKMPDIDVDFDSRYRDKVFEYLNKRHAGNCAQVISYGKYMIKNLINDIVKVYNRDKERISVQEKNKVTFLIEECINKKMDFMDEPKLKRYVYMKHFVKLFKNIRYYGTHASGVAICKDMTNYVALIRKGNDFVTCYDLGDLETLGILKMDVLGLKTISICTMIEEVTKTTWTDKCLTSPMVYSRYSSLQDLEGMFQFNSRSAREVVAQVEPNNLEELTACSALNRPAPLRLGVVEDYADAKRGMIDTTKKWYKHSKDTYGCLIYQEQVMKTVVEVAGLGWDLADKIMKDLKPVITKKEPLFVAFVEGAMKHSKMKRKDAEDLYIQMVRYLFNKCLDGDEVIKRQGFNISIAEMYRIKNDKDYAFTNGHRSLWYKYNIKGYGYCLSMNENKRLVKNEIVDIRYQGVKKTYEVELENGNKIKCTMNHKFPTPKGEFKLEDLKVGNRLYINAGYEEQKYKCKTMFGELRDGYNSKKGKMGFQKKLTNNALLVFDNYRKRMEANNCLCELCKNKIGKELHHIDNDHDNNCIDNFQWLCVSCHKKVHYKKHNRKKWLEKGLLVKTSKIISIKYVGEKDVYDVEVDNPYHNFLTKNNIITSNSHATAYTYLSCYQMYQMIKYPLESLWSLMVNAGSEDERKKYEIKAAKKGIVILLAHVNGPVTHKIMTVDGQTCIQQGTSTIKGVGLGTAEAINANGPYKSLNEIKAAIPKRTLRSNVITALDDYGSLIFNKNTWMDRCINYNIHLHES